MEPTKTRRATAVLRMPRRTAELFIYATTVLKQMSGNVYFPNPYPPLADVRTAADDFQAAEVATLMWTKGTVSLRNAKRLVLVGLLERLITYVQSVADAMPEEGPAIIQSSGFSLRKTPALPQLGFHATRGSVSGSVKIVAPAAARRAAYDWECSTDGGKTWLTLPSTLRSRTSLTGLTPLTTVQFRYRVLTKTGESDWSQPTSIIVL